MGNTFVGYYGNDPDSTSCGFEAVGLRDLCEAALPFPAVEYKQKRANMWKSLRGFVRQKQREAAAMKTVAGGKYPQLCALGRQLQSICGDHLRVLVCQRPLAESVESMCRRLPKMPRAKIQAHQQFLQDRRADLVRNLKSSQSLMINYHDMILDPVDQAGRIAEWLGREITDEQIEAVKAWVCPNKMHVNLEGVDDD
jgi:hypothetical protein